MGTTVKKTARSGQANKSGTRKPAARLAAGLKASGHKSPAQSPVHQSPASQSVAPKTTAGHKPPAGGKPAAAKPSQAAKPTPAKKSKVTPLKSAPPKAAPPKSATPKAAPAKPAAKAPPPPEIPALEAAPPAAPKPPPPKPVVAPSPVIQAPPTPKPNLVKLASLEPADAARLTAVRNLLEAEGRHDLPGILACFGSQPTLEFAGGPRHIGAERVGQIYGDLLRAFPDLTVEVMAEHLAERSIVVEMVLRGTHRQQWLGMAPRGRPLSLPVCNVFLFDKRDQISALRIYLDRNLAIVQLTSGLLR
jgi:hypothetical protein